MTRSSLLFAFSVALLVGISLSRPAVSADEKLGPSEPIAAIDGDPVYLGELNLILTTRLKAKDLNRLGIEVQQATAALLVRRHLAMKTLEAQGGDALEAMLQRHVDQFAAEAKRRGSSLQKLAEARMADEKSMISDLRWQNAWSQYLKSRLTEKNLRRFFESRRDRYAGSRWRVSQIFVKTDMRDADSVTAAEKSVTELADQIRASGVPAEAFSEAAIQYSDSGSAAEGGMVGWVEKDGDLPSSVMAAVRKTSVDSISTPVRSPLGIHLVFVHETEPGKLSFDDLTDQAQLRRDAANALFDALLMQQRDAKVSWFVPSLKPPQEFSLIPPPVANR